MASVVLLTPFLITALRRLQGRGARLGVTAAALLLLGYVAGAPRPPSWPYR